MAKFIEVTKTNGSKALVNLEQVAWIEPTEPAEEKDSTTFFFSYTKLDGRGQISRFPGSLHVQESPELIFAMVQAAD